MPDTTSRQDPPSPAGPLHPRRREAEALLSSGLSVRQVADRVGVAYQLVWGWGRRLRARRQPGAPFHPGFDEARQMLQQGLTVPAIAAAIGVSTDTVWRWRRRLIGAGVTPGVRVAHDNHCGSGSGSGNNDTRPPTDRSPLVVHPTTPLRAQGEALLRAGRTTLQVCAALAVSQATVREWRRKLSQAGLPRASDLRKQKARDLRAQGMMPHDIAAALGVSRRMVYVWIEGLRPRRRPRVTAVPAPDS